MKHKLAGTAIAIGLLAACVSAQSIGQATGAIDGVVFTVDANGGHAVIPTARISLDGPAHIEAESDGAGKFAFNAVPPGAYTINAQAPGLVANRSIEVTAASTSELALEMKVQAVVESTTVTASTDQIDTKESPGTSTIGESAIRNMVAGDDAADLVPDSMGTNLVNCATDRGNEKLVSGQHEFCRNALSRGLGRKLQKTSPPFGLKAEWLNSTIRLYVRGVMRRSCTAPVRQVQLPPARH